MIKRLFLLLLILSASDSFSQSPFFALNPAEPDLRTAIIELLPTDEATESEKQLLELLANQILSLANRFEREDSSVRVQSIPHTSAVSGHSFSESLHVRISGRSERSLVFFVPVNTPPFAHNTPYGAPGILAALELVFSGIEQQPETTLHVVFGTATRRTGSLFQDSLVSLFEDETVEAVIGVDVLVPDRRIEVVSGSIGVVSPPWLTELVRQSLVESGVSATVLGTAEQLFRIGARPSGRDYLIRPFLEQDIPAVLLVDRATQRFAMQNDPPPALHPMVEITRSDILESARDIYNSLARIKSRFDDVQETAWDRNAIRYTILDRTIVVGETTYLVFLLISLALVFAYGVTHRQSLARYIRTLRRNFLSLPLLFGLSYVLLLAFGRLSIRILILRGTPELTPMLPVALFGFKFFGAFLVLQMIYLTFRRLPLSRNGSFYSAASILVLLVSVFIFGSVSIATAAPFVAALLATVLFTLTPNRFLKSVFLVLAVIPPAILVYSFLALEEGLVVERLVSEPVTNILPTLVVMPYLMLLVRMDFLIRHPVSGGRSFAMKLLSIVVASGLVLSAIQLASAAPFSAAQPQRILIRQEADMNSGTAFLEIESVAVADTLSVRSGNQVFSLGQRSTRTREPMNVPDSHVQVRVDEETFLTRRIVDITITSDQDLETVNLSLHAPTPILVYQSTLPFRSSAAGTRIDLVSGRNTPQVFELRIVIPAELSPELEVTSVARDIPELSVEYGDNLFVNLQSVQTRRQALLEICNDQ